MWQETDQFLQFVIPSLTNTMSSRDGALCFRKICQNTAKHLSSKVEALIPRVLPENVMEWKASDDKNNILQGLAILICRKDDPAQITENLRVVIMRFIQPFENSIQFIRTQEDKERSFEYSRAIDKLNLMSEFIKQCQSLQREPAEPGQMAAESPIEPIFHDLHKLVISILTEFPALCELCEASTRLLKHCIRIVPESFCNSVPEYIDLLLSNFKQQPNSALIYSLVSIFKEYKDY